VLYDNTKEVGWHMGYGDFDCSIDVNTYRKIPWENNTPFFLMDFESAQTGKSLSFSPRNLLKNVIRDVEKVLCPFSPSNLYRLATNQRWDSNMNGSITKKLHNP
jgi:glutamine synthetase